MSWAEFATAPGVPVEAALSCHRSYTPSHRLRLLPRRRRPSTGTPAHVLLLTSPPPNSVSCFFAGCRLACASRILAERWCCFLGLSKLLGRFHCARLVPHRLQKHRRVANKAEAAISAPRWCGRRRFLQVGACAHCAHSGCIATQYLLVEVGMGEEEDDPDWLQAFQAPSTSPVMLSSGSDASPEASPTRTYPSKEKEKGEKEVDLSCADDRNDAARNSGKTSTSMGRKNLTSEKDVKQDDHPRRVTQKKKLVTLSSGSDATPGNSPSRADEADHETDELRTARRKNELQAKGKIVKVAGSKSVQDQTSDILEHQEEVAEEDMQDKPTGNSISQRLPLFCPDKVQRSKALIECDGDSIDLSGDVGAVGRLVVSNGSTGNPDLLLDLKGTIYKTTIVPSRTFCVVNVGQAEAKIEAIMNDFIQLQPQSNLFEAETMMEGTLDGFTFDSDEEGDKLPEAHASQNDQNNEDEDQPEPKTKRKADKPVGKGQKKAKVSAKAPKKVARKTQTTKRTRKLKK